MSQLLNSFNNLTVDGLKKSITNMFGNKDELQIFVENTEKFTDKIRPFCKIYGDNIVNLSDANSFGCNVINPKAKNYYDSFIYDNPSLNKEKHFKTQIEKYNNEILPPVGGKGKKEIEFIFNGKKLRNKKERGNVLTYDYEGSQIVFYMFSNNGLNPIDAITVKNKGRSMRNFKDLNVKSGLLSTNKEIVNSINEGATLFYPFYVMDINLYNIDIFLQELYYFFHYSTYALFFREDQKFLDYYKSIVVTINQLTENFKSDQEMRKKIINVIKQRERYSYSKALHTLIPGSFDINYFYVFYTIKGKLHPCTLQIKNINTQGNKMIVDTSVTVSEIGYPHNTIIDIFNSIKGIQLTSFVYENITDFNVKKDISFMTYEQLGVLKNIIRGYQTLFPPAVENI